MTDNNGGTPPLTGFLNGGWDPAIREGLEQMIVEHAGGLAALDFDDTVLDGDLSLTLLRDLNRQTQADLVEEYEADCRVDVRFGYAKLVETLIVGKTELELRDHTRTVLDGALSSGAIHFRPAIRDLIWALQRYGWDVWVVTASPAVVVAVAAQHIGIPANHVLGMWCEPDRDGRFTRPTREPITYRQGKVDALLTATGGRSPDFAVGDAMTDLEMLQSARYRLVLDIGDRRICEHAVAQQWWLEGGL